MPSLANLLEDYRNWRGRQEWAQKKGEEQFFGGDPRAQEQYEMLSGMGTADLGGLSGMAAAIKASHGSPHAFTKFDLSKIGTGEGAQAYGHGGYFAQGFDSPVAQDYQQALAAKEGLQAKISGKLIGELFNDIERNANRLPADKAQSEYEKLSFLEDLEQQPSFQHALARIDDESIIPWAKALEKTYQPAGYMYNVELKWPSAEREAADPLGEHHLLDWDAPLSEQPGIAAKLGFSTKTKDQIHDEYDALVAKHGYYHEMPPEIQAKVEQLQNELNNQVPNLTGEQFYSGNTENDYLHSVLSGKRFSKEQSDYLRNLGIPGIRYLDQASRSAGQGSRNYVIFDQDIPNIVTRNGVSLSDLLRQ